MGVIHTNAVSSPALAGTAIPVVVDAIKQRDEFSMARCSYFCIQSETPLLPGTLSMYAPDVPVVMMNLTAIIIAPAADKNRFTSAGEFRDLFERVEKDDELYIDTNDIWMPNSLFGKKMPKRGSVYRIGTALFVQALRYRNEEISDSLYLAQTDGMQQELLFSAEETAVLSQWSEIEINLIRTEVRANPELRELRFTKEGGK